MLILRMVEMRKEMLEDEEQVRRAFTYGTKFDKKRHEDSPNNRCGTADTKNEHNGSFE
jgi:hypothetical protein